MGDPFACHPRLHPLPAPQNAKPTRPGSETRKPVGPMSNRVGFTALWYVLELSVNLQNPGQCQASPDSKTERDPTGRKEHERSGPSADEEGNAPLHPLWFRGWPVTGTRERERLWPQEPPVRQHDRDVVRPPTIPLGEFRRLVQRRVICAAREPRLDPRPHVFGDRALAGTAHVLARRAQSPSIEHSALMRDRQHPRLEIALRMGGPRPRSQMSVVFIRE